MGLLQPAIIESSSPEVQLILVGMPPPLVSVLIQHLTIGFGLRTNLQLRNPVGISEDFKYIPLEPITDAVELE
eukprot:12930103-Prorocentrum_lima.AAC.1